MLNFHYIKIMYFGEYTYIYIQSYSTMYKSTTDSDSKILCLPTQPYDHSCS